MKLRINALAAIATALLASSTFAQVSFPEVEPNSQKSEATAVTGIVAGDSITGTTTGTVTTLASTLVTTADMFRVQTGALALGIYKHRLTLTTTGTAGHTGSIRGVTQTGTAGTASTGGTKTTIDREIQGSSTLTTPARFNQWYGFGKQEEIYYRVMGAAATTAAYAATLSTSTVTPTIIPGSYESANPITIATVGQTGADTTLHIFDSNLDAIPGASNDDEGPAGPSLQSRLIRTLPAGTYYLAVSRSITAWDKACAADEDFPTAGLMDFPGSLVRLSSSTASEDFDFTISGSNGSSSITNQPVANSPYDATWFQFTVAAGAPPFNDACANATSINAGGTFGAALSGATNDGVASCDPGGLASKDVWFKYTNASTCNTVALNLDTCTSAADTVLSVYSVCGGSELACNDDGLGCNPTDSKLAINVPASSSVVVRVSDKGLGGGNAVLHVSAVVANDDCATPTTLPPGPGLYCFDNTSATTGSQGQAESACLFFGFTAVRRDQWFTYTATANGTANITTCGLIGVGSPSSDTKVGIYVGSGCPSAAAVACNDDSGNGTGSGPLCSTGSTLASNLNFAITCGTTYTIQLGMYGNTALAAFGQFQITETGSSCNTPFTVTCSGDGTDTVCPCGNPGLAGRGCDNTAATGGAALTSTGVASVSSPTLVLHGTNAVPFGPGLYYEGNATATGNPFPGAGPFGVQFGNGLRCAGGATNRLEIRNPSGPAGESDTTVDLQAFGAAVSGTTYIYQLWYRDFPNFGACTSGFNFSSAIGLTWVP